MCVHFAGVARILSHEGDVIDIQVLQVCLYQGDVTMISFWQRTIFLLPILPPSHPVPVLQAALLHDTIEDTDTSAAELEAQFGPVVARIVQEVTDDKSLPKQERKRQQVAHAPHCSHQAKLVKLADKLYNLRDLNRCTPVGQWHPTTQTHTPLFSTIPAQQGFSYHMFWCLLFCLHPVTRM